MLNSGTVLAERYRVEALHALGGMSEVYLAVDLKLQRRVAIKTPRVLSDRVDEQERFLEQFRSEALIVGSLEHPNLAKVLDLVEEQGRPFMVMQFIDGQNLHQELTSRTRRILEGEALEWCRQILDALDYLHGRTPAVIVRDLKPSNIIRSVEGHIYVTDFGIAKYYDPNASTRSIVRGLGSQGYAPLEQGAAMTDQRTDLYAFGATLLFLLTGEDPPEASTRVTHGTALLDPRTVNPSVSHRTWDAIQRLMAVVPRERPGSVAEARMLLFMSGPPPRPPSTSPSLGKPIAGSAPRSVRRIASPGRAYAAPPQRTPWNPVWILGWAIGLCLVLLALHELGLGSRSSPTARTSEVPSVRAYAGKPQGTPSATRRTPGETRAHGTVHPTRSTHRPETPSPDSVSPSPEARREGNRGKPSPAAGSAGRLPPTTNRSEANQVFVGRLVEYTGGSQMRQLTLAHSSTWHSLALRADTPMVGCDLNRNADPCVGAVMNVLATGGHDDILRAQKIVLVEARSASLGDSKAWAAGEILKRFLLQIRRGAYHEAYSRLSLRLTEPEFQEAVQAHEAYGAPRYSGPGPNGGSGFIVDVYFKSGDQMLLKTADFALIRDEGRWTITQMTFDLDSQARPTEDLGPIR